MTIEYKLLHHTGGSLSTTCGTVVNSRLPKSALLDHIIHLPFSVIHFHNISIGQAGQRNTQQSALTYFIMLSLLELVLLLLVALSHRALSTCVQHHDCDDIEETLAAIASDPQNVQQLEKLFYPLNGANLPSPAIIVYFLNYTGPLPQQCDVGFYPWDSYPAISTSYQEMEWYLWTTRLYNVIAPPLKILELGLYLPAVTFPFLFNRTCPLVQPTPIACLTVPYMNTPSREMITIKASPKA